MSAARIFAPSLLRGEGWGEGWILARQLANGWPACEKLSCAYGARVTFSLRGQRESNQRERPPRLALAGLRARQVRESVPGFSSGLLPARKGVAIHGDARCAAFSSPTHRRPGAPGKAGAHPARQRQPQMLKAERSTTCGALAAALLKSARWERAALPGAPMTWWAGGGTVRRMAGRDAGQFFAGTGGAVEKPRNPHADPQGRRPGGRVIGVPFLFGSFFFGQAKRKELGHRQVDEAALSLAADARNRSETRSGMTRAPRPAQKEACP